MTGTPSVTREQAALIAQLVRTVRPAWDQAATGKFVAEASREHRDLADLVHGCVRTAEDQALTSPASLTFAGPQWTRSVREVESAEERAARIQAQIDARAERERGHSLSDIQLARRDAAKQQIRETLAARRGHRQQTPKETR